MTLRQLLLGLALALLAIAALTGEQSKVAPYRLRLVAGALALFVLADLVPPKVVLVAG